MGKLDLDSPGYGCISIYIDVQVERHDLYFRELRLRSRPSGFLFQSR